MHLKLWDLFWQEDCDSDIWDDTALIAAYDAAVAPLKAKLAERTGDTSLLDVHKAQMQTHQKKKKKKKKSRKKQVNGWAVGDYCQAVYTQDGEVYEARIISINAEHRTCVVRYLGYGNEEEQSLEDLIPSSSSGSKKHRPKHHENNTVSASETDSMDTSRHSACSNRGTKSGKQDSASHKSAHTSSNVWNWPGFSHLGSSNLPPAPPMFPGVPPFGPFGGFSHPAFGGGCASSVPPMMVPPPPPPMLQDVVEDENEALCSMLLAWYMSGYHTGYYQGLRYCKHDYTASASSASMTHR
ncbi:hypothetical protein C0Q70_20753 [Pomacea canaliculata]|uniref:Tudor domain-containing protein n=1 Tax=Pomacea canaliculata TaxID=400727 RepID=A0A2T7NGH2_POMCA|nr:hypothetical protein C0Q70_20753 [Pomacea canaliculata]